MKTRVLDADTLARITVEALADAAHVRGWRITGRDQAGCTTWERPGQPKTGIFIPPTNTDADYPWVVARLVEILARDHDDGDEHRLVHTLLRQPRSAMEVETHAPLSRHTLSTLVDRSFAVVLAAARHGNDLPTHLLDAAFTDAIEIEGPAPRLTLAWNDAAPARILAGALKIMEKKHARRSRRRACQNPVTDALEDLARDFPGATLEVTAPASGREAPERIRTHLPTTTRRPAHRAGTSD